MAITYHNWRRILEIDVLWEYVGNGAQQLQVLMVDYQIYVASTDIVCVITSIYYRAEAERAYNHWLDERIQAELEEDDQYDSPMYVGSDGDLIWTSDGGSDGDA